MIHVIRYLALCSSLLILTSLVTHAQTPAGSPTAAPASSQSAAPAQPEPSAHSSGSWVELLKHAGTTGVVQIGLSVFGAIFIFERLFNVRRSRIAPKGLTERAKVLWNEGKFEELETLGAREPSTMARLISFIVKHRHAPLSDVSLMAGDLISQEITVHHQRAYPLGVISTLEPLLGLLGMILGMIETFQIVALAGSLGDPTALASGISEALVTTGLGIAIAIPFLAFFHYFQNRTNLFSAVLEKETTDLVSDWLLSAKDGSN